MKNKIGTGTIVLATLSGAMFGAIVGLLLAPKSGREIRGQMEGYIGNAKDTLSRVPEALSQASYAAWEALGDGAGPSHQHPRGVLKA